jgi:hypothetical protein
VTEPTTAQNVLIHVDGATFHVTGVTYDGLREDLDEMLAKGCELRLHVEAPPVGAVGGSSGDLVLRGDRVSSVAITMPTSDSNIFAHPNTG